MSDKRIALITGGARGIGRGVALDLAARGWRVAYCYRMSADDAEATKTAIEAAGGEARPMQYDVSDPEAVRAMIDEVVAAWGAPYAIVNCAGPYHRAKLLEETVEGWRSMFTNNLDPVFFTAKFGAPKMIEAGGGRIVSFAMASAERIAANTAVTAHFIAKSGVLQLSRALAKELAPHDITSNCVSPGFIDSKSAPAEELEKMTKRIPAGHVGTVDDTVAAVRFFLSDEARYITGANLQVAGGWGL